jgi:tellurite resistance protein TerC
MSHPWWMWAGFFAIVLVLLAFDLGVLHRKEHEIKVREALLLSLFYFVLAMLFNGGIFYFLGEKAGYEFFIGYLVEKSLSLDNIFVFVLIFSHFSVPKQYQHRVLFWGILGAILFRGVMIALGAALIKNFQDILYLFGAFLVITGVKMFLASGSEPDLENNRVLLYVRKHFRVAREYHGNKFFVRGDNGLRYITPLFMVLLLIEVTDIVFAVDSIPAIFAITTDPFIVFTSNIFAILGLRALYFALAAIIHRFHYLKYGLSVILVFIGGKMIINHASHAAVISTEMSLLFTVVALASSIVFSLMKTRGEARRKALSGWVPGSDMKE